MFAAPCFNRRYIFEAKNGRLAKPFFLLYWPAPPDGRRPCIRYSLSSEITWPCSLRTIPASISFTIQCQQNSPAQYRRPGIFVRRCWPTHGHTRLVHAGESQLPWRRRLTNMLKYGIYLKFYSIFLGMLLYYGMNGGKRGVIVN